jgi:hypothetical protein
MTPKFKKETHEIFSAIAPIMDKMGIIIRYDKYNSKIATAIMIETLTEIEKVLVKHERKNSKTTKEN